MKPRYLLLFLFPLLFAFSQPSLAANGAQQKIDIGMQRDLSAMQQFNALNQEEGEILRVELKKRIEMLFFMGIGR